jgi:hypothetical protein
MKELDPWRMRSFATLRMTRLLAFRPLTDLGW